ncbi:MAG: type II toxin-antitoxin system RelE/ParE family toxin [Pyrinomonadaceae bacterium]
MKFEVIITPSAKADIFETRTWLAENHPGLAEKWLWQIVHCITSLSHMPERCPVSDETSAFDVEVRHLLCGDKRHVYRILFSIRDTKVYVLRVRSTRQKRLTDLI